MEYNFTGISNNVITELEKKKRAIKLKVLDNINNFIHVLNNQEIIKKQPEITQVVMDILNDEAKAASLQFTEAMMKVQRALRQYL